jgi:formylglycine-generating enzyme required for sulfatase activity
MTVSGKLVVAIIGLLAIGTAAGLIWYKRQPQLRTLPFTLQTDTGTMYLVPSGTFRHGAGAGQEAAVPAFYIDQTEVTNEAYARFARATGRELPPGFPAAGPEYPVVNVTVTDAMEFCKWAGKRLPDAIEWEKAARGTRGHRFPWGDSDDVRRANVSDNTELRERGLLPADSMPQNAAPSRALHMAGNAAEFVRTLAAPDPDWSGTAPPANEPWFPVRGGSYRRPMTEASGWSSVAVPVRHRADDIGFRCAKDPSR